MTSTLPIPLTVDPSSNRFDYASLDRPVADQARSTAERIRNRFERDILETGRDLIAIKKMLDHGNFGRWLKAEFEWTDRTARNLMRAAELADTKSETVSVLPITALYRLAAPSTPDVARDAIIARLEEGEIPSMTEINGVIAKARGKESAVRTTPTNLERKLTEKSLEASPCVENQETRGPPQIEQEDIRRCQQECAVAEAIELLRQRLGSELPTFFGLLKRADVLRFADALYAMLKFDADEYVSIDKQSAVLVRSSNCIGYTEHVEGACSERKSQTYADAGDIPDFLNRCSQPPLV